MEGAYGKAVLAELREPAKALREKIPGTYEGFVAISKAAMAAGTIDAKTKEFLALAVAVASQCDGCIASHTRGAAMKGATPEEVAEVLGVTIFMLGGPGTVYAPRAYESFLEFYEQYGSRAAADS